MKRLLGIEVARTILTGDLDQARRLAGERTSWTIPEYRAIAGALRKAARKWGPSISPVGGVNVPPI